MTPYKMTLPNYTEEEVWDLLSEYLIKKCQADSDSIQRGIYVDLYRDGSIFKINDHSNEFAYLYCNRNLNFNISGNIVFNFDPDRNEEFTLEGICSYLDKPFPKPVTGIELTEEERQEKFRNLKTIKTINKANRDREKIRAKVRNACVSLIHAFEYERSLDIKNELNHFEQVLTQVEDFNFIQERGITNFNNMLIIHPSEPVLDDLLIFFQKKKELIKNYFKVKYKEIEELLKDEVYPEYSKYFSERMRRFGILLIPLYNLDQQLVSALNIANISLENTTNFMVLKENSHTKGSFQLNAEAVVAPECIFLTTDIDTADTLARATSNPIFAAINEDNLIEIFRELKEKYPETFIVLVINNPFSQFLNTENKSLFRRSSAVQLMIEFGRDPKKLIRSGVVMPSLDLTEKSSLTSFSDICLEFGVDEVVYQINHELNALIDRIGENINETLYISKAYATAKNILFGNHHLKLPELVTQDEITHQTHETQEPIPNKPVIPTHGENSVLFIEKRKSLIDWFNEPMHPDILKKEKMFQDQTSRFINEAPIETNDEFN